MRSGPIRVNLALACAILPNHSGRHDAAHGTGIHDQRGRVRQFRLALAQMNSTVGDLAGNTDRITALVREAAAKGADLVAFPELAITGYPPEDLLFKRQFLADADKQLRRVVAASAGIAVVVGTPDLSDGDLYNAAAVAHDGKLVGMYHKTYLPNYGVFDEDRYFRAGRECPVYVINGVRVGVNICEDIWYAVGPTSVQASAGAEVVVNINASPFHRGKGAYRQRMIATRAADHEVFVAHVNMTGGQDELVFDGQSLVYDHRGELVARGPQFEEALLVVDVDADAVLNTRLHDPRLRKEPRYAAGTIGVPRVIEVSEHRPKERGPAVVPIVHEPMDPAGEVHAALVTGTRDYVRKSGFKGAVIGLSGGVDSALVAAIAAEALGPEQVTTFFMPSRYTSRQSYDDAARLAQSVGVRMVTLPIDGVFERYLNELAPLFEGRQPDTTEENLQARIRGNLLMAASNKFGWLVLTTGNKSEMATGYATLYGDMAGGFAVIKDVPKTLVWQLCRHLNAQHGREVIPESIIVRPPTAELRENQKDEDSLPPYALLDRILQAYVEDDWSVDEMVNAGMPPEAVARTVKLVDRSEYKRRQAPPGVKITHRAFGRDRRLPIVNRYQPI